MPSQRSSSIQPFQVMQISSQAAALQSTTTFPILHLEIGQPKHPPPSPALESALLYQSHGYTGTSGFHSLRVALSCVYNKRYKISVSPQQILITTGASSALVALFSAAFDSGNNVALPAPGYPCHRNVLHAVGVNPILIPTYSTNYKLRLEDLEKVHQKSKLHGVVIASPNNPTGTIFNHEELVQLSNFCKSINATLIVDETYHAIGPISPTALQVDNTIILGSFSKFYCLPGYRIGWTIIPCDSMRQAVLHALQNMSLCAPSISQGAALGALNSECEGLLKGHVNEYMQAIKVLTQLLQSAGFEVQGGGGGFYVWANCESVCQRLDVKDSVQLCEKLLTEAFVATTPGVDFDPEGGRMFVRFCCVGGVTEVKEAGERILRFVKGEKAVV